MKPTLTSSRLEWLAAAQIEDAQRRQFAQLLTRALLFPSLEKDDWTQREGHENFRIAVRDRRVVGGLTVQHVGQWFGGHSLECGAVRCVAVAADARRQGIASFLLVQLLRELRARATPLAALFPSNFSVYRHAGFELGGTYMVYRVPTHSLVGSLHTPHELPTVLVHEADAMERPAKEVLYRARAAETAGNLDRNEFLWLRQRRRPGDASIPELQCYHFIEEHRPVGYVIFSTVADSSGNVLLHCHDMVLRTQGAVRACLQLLGDQRTIVDHVSWAGRPNDPLLLALSSPNYSVKEHSQWMLRIVDVVSALERRGWPKHLRASLGFRVADPFLPENEGTYQLEIEDGHARVTTASSSQTVVHVRGLAALYSGHMSAMALREAGLVDASDDVCLQLTNMFQGPVPWMPDAF